LKRTRRPAASRTSSRPAVVGRIGDRHEQHRVGEAVADRLHAAGDRLRDAVDGVVVEIDPGQVDEVELLLLGEKPGQVALADPAVSQHDLAEAAVGLLRLDERVAHGGTARDAVAHDQAAQREIPQVHCRFQDRA
jgi:hypothetical protein